jgi:hypothetical protein
MPTRAVSTRILLLACVAIAAAAPAAATTTTPTPSPTPNPTGVLGAKTSTLHAFDLATGAPVVGAASTCGSPRDSVSGVTDSGGDFACRLELRDTDTILIRVAAPGFGERRRGYAGLDLWRNQLTLQVGLLPDGLCGGDCDGDYDVAISDLVRVVERILDDGSSGPCPLADVDGDGRVAVNDAVAAINTALAGCPPSE